MIDTNQANIYRSGKYINLTKSTYKFIVHTVPAELKKIGIDQIKSITPASTRIRPNSSELEAQMTRVRTVALMATSSSSKIITKTGLVQSITRQYRRETRVLSASELRSYASHLR